MPITPDGKITDASGNPTGQTVDLNTGAISGVQNTPTPTNFQSQPTSPIPQQTTQSTQPSTQPTAQTSTSPQAVGNMPNLSPGTKGADVGSLQKFLMSMGFNIPALQNNTAQPGYFGPQTQSALSQFQQQYGVPTSGYSGYFGPQTKSIISQNQELAQKFNDLYAQQKGAAPQNNADARSAMATLNPPQQDPFQSFQDSYFAMNPMVKNLYDTLQTITSSANTKQSFVDTYNSLYSNKNIPAGIPGESLTEDQVKLMNMNHIMKGTEDDIRDEINKAGGSATESQVQAMVGTRNRILMKQASYLQDSMQLKQNYVDKVVGLTQADRAQVNAQLDRQIGLSEKMATIQQDMNNAARTNYEHIVTNIGYDGLASTLQQNPNQQRYVESLLGLPGGSLSNPTFIQNAKTLKEQTLAATMANRDIINAMAKERLGQGAQRIQIDLTKSGLASPSTKQSSTGQPNGQSQIVANPYQDKLEKEYEDRMMKVVAARSGDLGVQNSKVSQALHLRALANQYYDPKNQNYNIPSSQYEELAMGLANLVAPTGSTAVSDRQQLLARTGASTVLGALQYITGTPQNGNTQDMIKNLIDSIDRQGQVAQNLRDVYTKQFIGNLAPSSLDPARKARVEQAQLPQFSKNIGLSIGGGFKDGDQQEKNGWLYQRDSNGTWNPIKQLQ